MAPRRFFFFNPPPPLSFSFPPLLAGVKNKNNEKGKERTFNSAQRIRIAQFFFSRESSLLSLGGALCSVLYLLYCCSVDCRLAVEYIEAEVVLVAQRSAYDLCCAGC